MRITVTVAPRARQARIEQAGDGSLRVAVTAPPHQGRANEALIEALAEHFRVPRSRIRIVRGHTGRRKIVDIVME
jgi:uncharacterized protein